MLKTNPLALCVSSTFKHYLWCTRMVEDDATSLYTAKPIFIEGMVTVTITKAIPSFSLLALEVLLNLPFLHVAVEREDRHFIFDIYDQQTMEG